MLCLDHFYKDGDDPTLPRRNGQIDWESPASWDAEAAVEVIGELARHGRADVPVYAINEDRRVATRSFELASSPLFVAEGIFAAEIVGECRRRGLLAGAYALRRPRSATFLRRLARDLTEQRKGPHVLLLRGVALLRAEPAVLRRQTGLGAEAARGRDVLRRVAGLLAADRAPVER
ncbi:ATP-binding protein [Micromonospora sp. WMMD1082]|uniref:ATP-binding protein n=1 Tax=Micromonospora sp. WMMD1082 TaxID=3016104 RepID=UPI0024163933|nr:ATP-binding protein [Micromonospora sp. WMMD1082]MDG4793378.1 ATP-binding protein [Micromonospora sp. WMMD1082]